MKVTKKHVSHGDSALKKAVASNMRRYKKTYQLLDQYDKSPKSAPTYEVKRRTLQKALQYLSQ